MPAKPSKQNLSEAQERVLTYIRLRWGAILLILVTTVFLRFFSKTQIPFSYISILISIGIIYNLMYPFIVKSYKPFSEHILFTYLRPILDMSIITLLIHFTGGGWKVLLSSFIY